MAETEIIGMGPAKFRKWFGERWRQGEHVALHGPTGQGKSTLANFLLTIPGRDWVMALDAKGGDSTMQQLVDHHGFTRMPGWPPPPKKDPARNGGKPARYVVGFRPSTRLELPRLRTVMKTALEDAFDVGGWTVYLDELQVTTDSRMMGLSGQVETLLVAARDRGVSVVSSFQRTTRIPHAAHEMCRWFFTFYTRDLEAASRVGEMAGRSRHELRGALKGLEDHAVLVFSGNPREPIVVTRAPAA